MKKKLVKNFEEKEKLKNKQKQIKKKNICK